MSSIANILKRNLSPERYYAERLNGSFGKATGKGWHQWNGLCPFHNDKRPGSLVINRTTGAYRCFSCGTKGGDIIDFHMQRHSLSFSDAFFDLRRMTKCVR
ncbi:hypothetical protein GH722_19345 [Alphaproteobacteria bacterium HT1-32]|nr:hypothetical protein [Alphaproteobacteria bacterium HT1-32]